MRANIVSIGNSKGIRIPKVMLKESGIDKYVELKASKGSLKITPLKTSSNSQSDTALLSENSLSKDWSRPEEEEAWEKL